MRISISLSEHVCGVLVLQMWRIRPVDARNIHTRARARRLHAHARDYGTLATQLRRTCVDGAALGTGPSLSSSKTHQETTLCILDCVDVVEAKKLDYSLTIIHGGSCLMVCYGRCEPN